MRRFRIIFGTATLAYLLFVAAVTLTPEPFNDDMTGFIDSMIATFEQHPTTAWLSYDVVEFTANICMFVPVGAFITGWTGARRWWIGVACGVAYSLMIEAAQATVLAATRYATLSDVIANSLGALVGAAAVVEFARVRAARRSRNLDAAERAS